MADALTAHSRPYPWPWHGAFEPRRTALLVVRDGGIARPGASTEALVSRLVQFALQAGVTVGELTAQLAPPWPDFGADFRVVRPHHGGFTGTDLDFILRRRHISELIFVGHPFELGADCTMRQANDLGYECLALTDCSTGLSPDTLAGAFSSIQLSGGIFGAVTETAAVFDLFARANQLAPTAGAGAQR
ncbi:MAG: isochorismatase family protein [Chloroflexi bacterium]|nr:isochorismatase family protein [Chloroflexota bacterium]